MSWCSLSWLVMPSWTNIILPKIFCIKTAIASDIGFIAFSIISYCLVILLYVWLSQWLISSIGFAVCSWVTQYLLVLSWIILVPIVWFCFCFFPFDLFVNASKAPHLLATNISEVAFNVVWKLVDGEWKCLANFSVFLQKMVRGYFSHYLYLLFFWHKIQIFIFKVS